MSDQEDVVAILAALSKSKVFAVLFKKRKQDLHFLQNGGISNAEKEVERLAKAKRFADANLLEAEERLSKYKQRVIYMAQWVAENEKTYEDVELAASDAVQKVALSIQKKIDSLADLPDKV